MTRIPAGSYNKLVEPLLATVDCVLFDLDGTLVETNIDFPLMKREMVSLAAEYGMDADQLEHLDILAIVDTTVEALYDDARDHEAKEMRSRAMQILEDIEMRHAESTQEIPYARELVTELRRRRIQFGIVTRNCRGASWQSLRMVGIVPDVLVCREDTVRHKPHPDPLRVALGIFGSHPGNSIMVGDHIMDVQSGKAAGMATIGLLKANRPPDFFDEIAPDFVARDLREVLDAIIGHHS